MASWRENGRRSPLKAHLRDLGTMALIGDRVAGLISPRQHCLNSRVGPRPYRKLIDKFVKHPNWTRMLAPDLRSEILDYHKDLSAPIATKETRKRLSFQKRWTSVRAVGSAEVASASNAPGDK